jgi:uncharacterized protein YceK
MKLLSVLALLTLAGCGSIEDLARAEDGQRVFGGVRYACERSSRGFAPCHSEPAGIVYVFDFPFSAALDIELLPLTVPLAVLRPDSKAPSR